MFRKLIIDAVNTTLQQSGVYKNLNLAVTELSAIRRLIADYEGKLQVMESKLAAFSTQIHQRENAPEISTAILSHLEALATKLSDIVSHQIETQESQVRLHAVLQSDRQTPNATETTLVQLKQALAVLQRTAAGRGNVSLPNERLLVRFSLPPYFEHHEPIYFVNADDKLIVPKLAMTGYYELPSTRFVLKTVQAQNHIIDVGANFGYYTMIFASLTGWQGRVLAFEPEARMYRLLLENKLINWVDPWVHVIKAACADQIGTTQFFSSKARAANTGPSIPKIDVGLGEDFDFFPVQVNTVRVDDSTDFLDARVDFMKIDVEGGEPLVLRGARRTIAENPQIKIMMEWSPEQLSAAGHSPSEFAAELTQMGLKCHTIDWSGEICATTWSDVLGSDAYQNLVLLSESNT
jgi:FkbM family methyltransferase